MYLNTCSSVGEMIQVGLDAMALLEGYGIGNRVFDESLYDKNK